MKIKKVIESLASVRLTLSCLGLAMFLILLGTLAQIHMGTFAAQKEYFNSWWVMREFGDLRVPLFPGGLTVGALWVVNLLAAFADQFKYRREDAGILLSHFGLILLLVGQFLTQTLARESHLPLRLGESRRYTETFQESELVITKSVSAEEDEVTSIPESFLAKGGGIRPAGLPFTLEVRRFMKNSRLDMGNMGTSSIATQGVGTRVAAREIPATTSDDEINTMSVYLDVREGGKSLGVWLVSLGLGAPQSFVAGGQPYHLDIRWRRHYLPFTLTLKEFHHDIYPGTDIPKNFSSLVHLSDPGKEDRDALIYMNHPLRYGGYTFYQSSFGEGDRMSVFQVVENPASVAPYVSCALVVLGLAIQFLMHLVVFLRKKS